MFKQTSEHFQSSLFSKYHYRFKKCFSAQHCLVSTLEKWKSATEEVVWRTLFIKYIKDIWLSLTWSSDRKIKCIRFSMSALWFLPYAKSENKQNIFIGKKSCLGFHRGLWLGLSPFLCDLFLIMENIDIASYAGDTPYSYTPQEIQLRR